MPERAAHRAAAPSPLLRDLAEQSDAREVGADVVVQVGGDARAHVGDLEQARHAIAIERGRPSNADHERSERQEPPALPDRTQDREGDGRGSALTTPSEFTARTRNRYRPGARLA